MPKPELELIIPEKCSHCKKIKIICEGCRVIKSAILVSCNGFIDKRSTAIITSDAYCPYPIKKFKGGAE